jgi:hypothetical protein
MPNDNADDQLRVCTPNESLLNGADKIIMGRGLINGDIVKNLDKVSDVSEAYARIDKEEWAKIIAGDVTLLRGIVDSTNNKIGILLGVKTTGEGKLRQTALNKHTLRQFTLSSTKPAKYKYILKDLDDAKANGALGNVDFGPRSLILGEHQLEATVISDENTNQTDIFATAETPTGSDMEDNEDWLGED